MRRQNNLLGIPTILLVFLVAAVPATADILVMEDGSELEIEGEWIEKGRMIEFTLPNGTYGAVRASEVDLEASRAATLAAEAAANAPPPPPPEKPEPVRVITDEDIPSAPLDVINASRDSVTARAIRVTNWGMQEGDNPDVVRVVRGTLRNDGSNPVSGLSLTITVIGENDAGEEVTLQRQARLDDDFLRVGESTGFELDIRRNDVNSLGGPSVLEGVDLTFDVSFESARTEDEGEGEDEETEG